MRILRLLLVPITLSVLSPLDVVAQTRVVRRLGDVRSIYVDRDSFEIDGPPCTKPPGKIFETCGDKLKKREKFLDALERWIGKYGVKVAKDAASADAVLMGALDMYYVENDFDSSIRNPPPRDTSSTSGPVEEWTVEASLENAAGTTLWKTGTVNAPKPGYGWSTIGKIKGKELAKEIEYSIRDAR
jgi:hypothetical protein